MENETKPQKDRILQTSIVISALIIGGTWIYTTGLKYTPTQTGPRSKNLSADAFEKKVLPPDGIILPVRWNDLGVKMIDAGVIDTEKFEPLYANRGGIDEETRALLYETSNGNLKMTPENSGVILNLLWALGLGNKNDILEKGPMTDLKYGPDGAGRFASTGGWTLGRGDAMLHYSKHRFFVLTPQQQEVVERISKNIYRPCCGNSTYFPDCNHGMAMLGLLELMASQGVSENEMYRVALQVNAFWFPDTYLTIAKYLEAKGIGWGEADPKELLGSNFSSAAGYRRILSEVSQPVQKPSGSCGV